MRPLLLLTAAALALAPASAAQPGVFGIGGQIGSPTGLTVKFAGRPSLDLAAEWDFENYFFVQGHVLLSERRFPGVRSNVRYFYGPGLFVLQREDNDPGVGFSFNAGVTYYTGPIEIFGQVTPRLLLTPSSDLELGAAAGLRFYP